MYMYVQRTGEVSLHGCLCGCIARVVTPLRKGIKPTLGYCETALSIGLWLILSALGVGVCPSDAIFCAPEADATVVAMVVCTPIAAH